MARIYCDSAAVIPLEDLRLLERLQEDEEDRIGVEKALKLLADAREEVVDWETAKRELRAVRQGRRRRAAS